MSGTRARHQEEDLGEQVENDAGGKAPGSFWQEMRAQSQAREEESSTGSTGTGGGRSGNVERANPGCEGQERTGLRGGSAPESAERRL